MAFHAPEARVVGGWLVALGLAACSGIPSESICTVNSAAGTPAADQCTGGSGSLGGTTSTGGTQQATGGASTGGTQATGGALATGGLASTGGAASTGGDTSTGGAPVTGGAPATGGAEATGGVAATGGDTSTGGTLSTGGTPATGGSPATGGDSSTGGVPATGGDSSTGGVPATGGDSSTGGAPATGGASSTGGAGAFCSTGTYAFCDDFEDGIANGWTKFEQNSGTPGVWAIASETGFDSQSTQDFQQTATAAVGYHYEVVLSATGGPFTDQSVSAWIKPSSAVVDDNTKVGVCARFSGTTTTSSLTGYCLFLRTDATSGGALVQVARKPSGGSFGSVSTAIPGIAAFAVGTWVRATLEVTGTGPVTLKGYINGVLAINVQDTTSPATALSGYPAFVTRQGSATGPAGTASFDNVTLTNLAATTH